MHCCCIWYVDVAFLALVVYLFVLDWLVWCTLAVPSRDYVKRKFKWFIISVATWHLASGICVAPGCCSPEESYLLKPALNQVKFAAATQSRRADVQQPLTVPSQSNWSNMVFLHKNREPQPQPSSKTIPYWHCRPRHVDWWDFCWILATKAGFTGDCWTVGWIPMEIAFVGRSLEV